MFDPVLSYDFLSQMIIVTVWYHGVKSAENYFVQF